MIRLLGQTIERLDAGWVWLYTAGMPRAEAVGRRDELASDQWEMTALARTEGWSDLALALQRLLRWLLGMPADMSWRACLGRGGFSREGMPDLIAACLLAFGYLAGLPLSMASAVRGASFAGHSGSQELLILIVPVVVALCVGGFLFQEVRRIPGTLISLAGVASLAVALWWTITMPLMSVAAALGILYRERRLRG
jgi:hypothetical protein